MQPLFEVADVLRKIGSKIENYGLNTWQLRTLSVIKKCRTSALGGHIDACDSCGNLTISYNSCRNRHCPIRIRPLPRGYLTRGVHATHEFYPEGVSLYRLDSVGVEHREQRRDGLGPKDLGAVTCEGR
jgi:hypothetical protein